MPEQEQHLTEMLKAVSEPARRRVLTLLVRDGPMRVTELAAHFSLSLNAVSKHIKVLEAAGLVTRETRWRDHVIHVALTPLDGVGRWLAALNWVAEHRESKRDSLTPARRDG